ncbi:amidohydrolase family protein [Aestuariicella hydrocarbonica]|uniref:Amidohydrolase family protein n=1 Tax=Pseudomaricurvus hydrocarbonicus TaxID=1470433 RepID=A0A9E5JWJ7_9GAMM|nr:amidohydrolase family protein [Aestuariicella hydrocarbonica]NHO66205.1 amidohydrolase family protein [Aestuariicella hydrocarbonica]
MKQYVKTIIAVSLTIASLGKASAQVPDPNITLITNINVFDGVNEKLIKNANIVITDNIITEVSTEPLMVAGGKVIDGGGRTMIPGMIDAHWHMTYCCLLQNVVLTGDIAEVAISGALAAPDVLMRGFTTVRDTGGNTFSIHKMIERGDIVGPRMLPSGPPITQTGGHLDYRPYTSVPTNSGDSNWYWYANALMLQADGVPEVTLRTREVMRLGATQIKIAAGGGVSSLYDPLDVRQYTKAELEAFVEVADTYNTYVLAHIFTDDAAQVALEAGVKSIEHGNLLSEKTLKLMKEKGAWLSVQPILNDDDAIKFRDPESTQKYLEVTDGTDRTIRLAKKLGVKMAWGTDMLFDAKLAAKQGVFVAKMKRWFTPYEIMKLVTSNNAELIYLSGPRNPYQKGKLGVINKGAYADLILVDGNPLENIDLIGDPNANFDLIMKDGKIYKNSIK